jgi:hypothetical protein
MITNALRRLRTKTCGVVLAAFAVNPACKTPSADQADAGVHVDAESQFPGVELTSAGGILYTAPLTIGGQRFAAQVDTGSTVTAVAGMGCTTCVDIAPLYEVSTTGVDTMVTASTFYGDGSSWDGEVFEDIAGVQLLGSTYLDFVSITKQVMFFGTGLETDNRFQGILGLGPADLLETGTTSFLDELAADGHDEILAFQLCPDSGTMWRGGFEPAAVAASPIPTPMLPIDDSQKFYAVQVTGLSVGTTSLASTAALGATIVDTGTSVSYVPTAVADALVAQVNGSAGFTALFPGQMLGGVNRSQCVSAAGVTVAQVDAMLPPLSISFPSIIGDASTTFQLVPSRSYFLPQGERFCLSIIDSGSDAPGALIGDAMLQSFVTVFDIPDQQIAFARSVGCANPDLAHSRPIAPPPATEPWYLSTPHGHGPRGRRGAIAP